MSKFQPDPLQGLLVVDLSQFLSAPSATLRLADLGARVIKVERPEIGDLCRSLYVSNVELNGESSIFQAINRNKESFAADLKLESERLQVLKLIEQADIFIHNFRPGVIDRLGFSYELLHDINPKLIYGEISGYGTLGPWKKRPGQDLLLQCLSGLTGLNGNKNLEPTPVGLALVDILSGAHLVQGVLAALVKRSITGEGSKVSVSMLESIVDFQFESITTYYHDGGEPINRSPANSAHAFLGAPYGIYQTSTGFIALAMGSIPFIGELLGCDALVSFSDANSWYDERDLINTHLANHLEKMSSQYWLSILEPADVWCAEVLNWEELFNHEGFQILDMIQVVRMSDGFQYETTRCPIKIDGEYLTSDIGAPILGEHSDAIVNEYQLG